MKIKIGIVDDDLLFVQLLKNYLENNAHYEVVLTSKSGNTFLQEASVFLDVLILDLRMNDGDGLEVLSALPSFQDEIKTIVLSSFYRRSFMGQMLKMGAHAFCQKKLNWKSCLLSFILYIIMDIIFPVSRLM
ncbi:response regulator transcription factor [Chryseobacterium sp. CH1]|uniref:response regulator transcription factor n=1 Tax=Chryseobacterium sp. CH1 TaxID=713551 RepID=UPI001E633161|nr:response regulator [Chryseobacterium sp. CH1]